MRRDLAERLLEKIMQWDGAEKARERAHLESFAAYKYDEYQQFSPGLRFLESLALWLGQFETVSERRIAYQFIRDRLVFISDSEVTHLVELAFPSFIRPKLLTGAALDTGLPPFRVKQILASKNYRVRLRKTLYLGLSDGARTDRFRRANPHDISNEQIWHAYDVSAAKAGDMQVELSKNLSQLLGSAPPDDQVKFNTVVLLDDFTASGTSYLRKDGKGGWKGKIAKIISILNSDDGLSAVIAANNVDVIIVIYVAAPQAVEHIKAHLNELPFPRGQISFHVVHELSADTKVYEANNPDIYTLINDNRYFDTRADDEHGAVGKESVRFGYAGCRLPVVLAHNTPNNSLFLLWAEDDLSVHGLFPRVSRHRAFE